MTCSVADSPTFKSKSPTSTTCAISCNDGTRTLMLSWVGLRVTELFYDLMLIAARFAAMVDPSPLAWPRRSHLRQLQEVSFFLPANILGKVLLEPNNPPEVVQIAVDALGAARGCLRTVLQSPAYNASVKFSGYLMRVDLSFAALLILKLAAILPHLVSPDEIAEEITQLSNLLSVCAGTQRYSTTLR